MLFKLALKNIKKSVKDYSIYFFTLVIGVIVFYVFNVYDFITSASVYSLVYSLVMGCGLVSAVALYFLLCRTLKNIDVLERRICKRLDKQGYPHEKREGTLYITKHDNHFRVFIRDSFDRRIKHLYFLYDFYDDNFGKVSIEGWARAANSRRRHRRVICCLRSKR